MKLFAIVTSLAVANTNAMYLACCETDKQACPSSYNNIGNYNKMGTQFQACCHANENANVVGLSECIHPMSNGNGPSIMVMSMEEPVSITNTAEEVPTTSLGKSDCCEVAAAQPSKLRIASGANSVCPADMFSIEGASYDKNNAKYQVCCDRDGQASEVNPGGIPACRATKNPVSAQGQGKPEPELISLEEETNVVDIPTQINGSIEDSENTLGSNSASATNMAAVGMVLVGVAIQMAI